MGELTSILRHSVKSYLRNLNWILFFSIPFLLAIAIPFFSPLPSYMALGGTFLRTGSIPQLSALDVFVIAVSFLASLFLVSFAVVSINLVIKSQRTMTNVRNEVVKGIEKYAFTVFLFFLLAWALSLLVSMASYELRLERILGPLFSFFIYSLLFYVPAAMVVDELKPGRAIEASLLFLLKKPVFFIAWLAIGFILLALADLATLLFFFHPLAQYAAIVFNSLVVLPFLTVMQTQMYLTKYTLL